MAQRILVLQPRQGVWERPAFEEISVSAEASAYMGAWKDEDWV
jgi:coenzyme PQQ precursor peptide PqqA